MNVAVEVGRGVRVGEAVQVAGGVRVGVFVHIMGVRVTVGVADKAARNACMRAVCVAAVEIAVAFLVAVEEAITVRDAVGVEDTADVACTDVAETGGSGV